MLHRRPRKQELSPSRACAKSASLAWVCIVALLVADVPPAHAAAINGVSSAESFVAGFLLGLVLLIAFALRVGTRLKSARHKLQANELADHREYERNLAQQELIRRLEEERKLAKEKLQFESQLAEYEKYASLVQLALGAAHEINNPLLGILSHLELERRHTSGDERSEVEQCIEGARRVSSAVRGLLGYARPGRLVLGKVSLFKLAREALKFVEHQPMFRNLTLTNRVPLDLPPLTADVNHLSQILMNLLLNAAQATPAGGSITIAAELEQTAGVVELRVTDSGSGIPADILPHIFEPFFTTKRGKGTGLGLSISQNYVRSHGGDIQVESVEGSGATVRVTFPVHQPGNAAEYREVIA